MKNYILKSKIKLAIAIVAIAFSVISCKKTKTEGTSKVVDYSNIKTTNWRASIGDTFDIEGYYDEVNGVGKIYSLAEDQSIDGVTPESHYLWIYKPSNLPYVPNYSSFIGRKVKIKGVLGAVSEQSIVTTSRVFGDPSLAGLSVLKIGIDSTIVKAGFLRPVPFSFCERYPVICQSLIDPFGEKVAFLYSGGINAGNANYRYWNDIYVMYGILKNQYGYSSRNIIVCYKNGIADDHASEVPINFAASPAGFDSAIALLKSRMNSTSKFFCFINNHGGGYETSTGLNYGLTDTDGDDTRAGVTDHNTDEQIYYYNSSTTFSDDKLASKINSLKFGTGIFLLKPCFSGGLIWDLRGTNRVLIAAGTEFEVTHGHSSNLFGDLTFHFLAAISGKKPDGSGNVNADSNGDSKVSMKEIFDYVRANHTPSDHPQYSDDGTGNSIGTSPSTSSFGAGVFL